MKNLLCLILLFSVFGCAEENFVADTDYKSKLEVNTKNGKIESVAIRFPYGSRFECDKKENLKRVIDETEELLRQLKSVEEQMPSKYFKKELKND